MMHEKGDKTTTRRPVGVGRACWADGGVKTLKRESEREGSRGFSRNPGGFGPWGGRGGC